MCQLTAPAKSMFFRNLSPRAFAVSLTLSLHPHSGAATEVMLKEVSKRGLNRTRA